MPFFLSTSSNLSPSWSSLPAYFNGLYLTLVALSVLAVRIRTLNSVEGPQIAAAVAPLYPGHLRQYYERSK